MADDRYYGTAWGYLGSPPAEGWNPWHGGQAFFTWRDGLVKPLIEALACPVDGAIVVSLFGHDERDCRLPGMSLLDAMGVVEQFMAERWLDASDEPDEPDDVPDDRPCPHCGRRG